MLGRLELAKTSAIIYGRRHPMLWDRWERSTADIEQTTTLAPPARQFYGRSPLTDWILGTKTVLCPTARKKLVHT